MLGNCPGRAPTAVSSHITSGSWWGKPNPGVGVSLDLTYGVGYIHGEAVCSIPHSFSIFSPFHIYPMGSSPHTKPHLCSGTVEQEQGGVKLTPIEQLSWKCPSWKGKKREGNELMV